MFEQYVCVTHCIHVDAVGVGPGMLKVLLETLPKTSWDLMKPDELLHS